jgi:hypothetical protein
MLQKRSPALLLLTATVTPPPGVPNLKRVDPNLRMQDYVTAFGFYLKLPTESIDRIVFLENSNNQLAEIKDLVARDHSGKNIEVISFDGLNYPPCYGRAYGEFKMLDHGFQSSRLLNEISDADYFWKVTGRLCVHNLVNIIATAPAQYEMLIDFQTRPTPMVDLRMYSCTRAGYRQLLENRFPSLREDQLNSSVEYYLYSTWKSRVKELGIVQRHNLQPRIGGFGGQHNEDYLGGINVIKYWIRSTVRFIFPGFWI